MIRRVDRIGGDEDHVWVASIESRQLRVGCHRIRENRVGVGVAVGTCTWWPAGCNASVIARIRMRCSRSGGHRRRISARASYRLLLHVCVDDPRERCARRIREMLLYRAHHSVAVGTIEGDSAVGATLMYIIGEDLGTCDRGVVLAFRMLPIL